MKFCKYCHTAMEDDAQSCPSCGKPWEPEEAPADAPAAANVTDAPVAQDSPAQDAPPMPRKPQPHRAAKRRRPWACWWAFS